ncbi:uracil-DNA glycosylase [Corynebacterium sp. J010B-136]|uniref:uracil-DNA glycosylase n=1 Tax=Corynebacterium sp. J010B-136 TaxID=2099401 RepID=UPI000CFA07AD|nr:uracil-DNA glycosylase [Corynebacterium sp. J010B-136]PQM75104.1 uracil-DNA glycosylase [Corynebacterium sp. J010B-136]
MHPDWQPIIQPALDKISPDIYGPSTLPARDDVMRAFDLAPSDVKVLILGQDPYPTPGHAMGLSFSTQPGVRPPRSLVNIYAELESDLDLVLSDAGRADGDLTSWFNQGVMLLNRVLTVEAGNAGSHRKMGWEEVTEAAIRALNRPELVAILWGKDAQSAARFIPDATIIASPHPSPLSARRGFFGSKPFSRANEALVQAGEVAIDWQL